MKKVSVAVFILLMSIIRVQADTQVLWDITGDVQDSTGWHYEQVIKVIGDTDMKGLAFNQFARKMRLIDSADTLTEIVPGYYLITSPRLNGQADTVTFRIDTRGYLVNCSYEPDGFHKVLNENSSAPVGFSRVKLTEPQKLRAFRTAGYPTAEKIYEFNESLKTGFTPGIYDIIPSFNSVKILENESSVTKPVYEVVIDETLSAIGPEAARIIVKDGKVKVSAVDSKAGSRALRIFKEKVVRGRDDVELPAAELVFSPDFEWRGLMIDIARNFQTPATLKEILRLMASNGLNKLHFHPVDDEAWRLELPSLPELTQVGGRRGWALDENEHLFQIFTGDGNPDNLKGSSNGYISKDEFIDILKFADSLNIDIVPEIESPGHARAAIKAMESRARKGDASFRLIHDNDTSVYTSAQAFHDNIMNPALESTYKFMETVINDIAAIYDEAGVKLTGIHIGGDEVPRNAWGGSEVAQRFMKENGITDEKQLHAYFVERVADILSKKNIPMYGWQEIALNHSDEYNEKIAPLTGGVNSWSTLVKKGQTPIPLQIVENGFPVILSNVNHFYFDLSYSAHPEEPGLSWGGHTSEFTAFDGYADKLCPTVNPEKGRIAGVNAHVFAETMRNPSQLLMYIVPKIFGLAERAAHSDTTYTVAEFNTIIGQKELPDMESRFAQIGIGKVHVNQPGIKVVEGVVYMNTPYEGGVIRYTTDGTEPNNTSAVYTEPFEYTPDADVRAKYYRNGNESVTTYLLTTQP